VSVCAEQNWEFVSKLKESLESYYKGYVMQTNAMQRVAFLEEMVYERTNTLLVFCLSEEQTFEKDFFFLSPLSSIKQYMLKVVK